MGASSSKSGVLALSSPGLGSVCAVAVETPSSISFFLKFSSLSPLSFLSLLYLSSFVAPLCLSSLSPSPLPFLSPLYLSSLSSILPLSPLSLLSLPLTPVSLSHLSLDTCSVFHVVLLLLISGCQHYRV